MRNVSCWPAKEAEARSSATAEERTAHRHSRSNSARGASRSADSSLPGFRNSSLMFRATASMLSSRSKSTPRSIPSIFATRPFSARKSSYAFTVTTTPRGTGKPAWMSCPKLAAFPPTWETIVPSTDARSIATLIPKPSDRLSKCLCR